MKYVLILPILFLSIFVNAQVIDSTLETDVFMATDEAYDEAQLEEIERDLENPEAMLELSEELIQAQAEYGVYSLEHRKKVFAWQLTAGKIIFVFVMLIVLMGLLLSYLHFAKSLKPGAEAENTELEMSTSGIKMNSSVIGLIILVLAIAFLYLYLVHVFPINEFTIDATGMPS
jgi:cytochrome c-type biogenesis protein CcmH/NrfG